MSGQASASEWLASGSVQPPKARPKPPPPILPPRPVGPESLREPRELDELSSVSTEYLLKDGFTEGVDMTVTSESSSNPTRNHGLWGEMPANHPTVTVNRNVDENAGQAVTTVHILVHEPCSLSLRVATPLPDEGDDSATRAQSLRPVLSEHIARGSRVLPDHPCARECRQ